MTIRSVVTFVELQSGVENYHSHAYRTPALYQNLEFSGHTQWSLMADIYQKTP